MFDQIRPMISPAILCFPVCFIEDLCSTYAARCATFATISAFAIQIIFNPPYENSLYNYLSGFLSSWYIIWSANVLLIHDVRALKRIQKLGLPSDSVSYCWECLPPAFSYRRVLWALDLSTNFRVIGWKHSSVQGGRTPVTCCDDNFPIVKPEKSEFGGPPSFVANQVRRLITACIALNLSRLLLDIDWNIASSKSGLSTSHTAVEILGTALAIYGFIDGLHALMAFIAVGLLGPLYLGAAGEAWMYPPLFGTFIGLKSLRIKAIWGRLWHDLFKGGFLTFAKHLIPQTHLGLKATGSLQLILCFGLSALVHAAASYSASSNVRSTLKVLLFFLSQPVGDILQELWTSVALGVFGRLCSRARSQKLVTVTEFFIGVVWIYITFPWGCQDVAMREAVRGVPLLYSKAGAQEAYHYVIATLQLSG
ncbi:hypothetical protein BGZ61DRAFT_367040 [Ilyonectria robusta]|uniref:uncharacterized protein n=1 Tax=Ilyonectria robusta TaxID=1079257 RepID=UPI001E8E5541|nr:uncharacterized protein BGZ61DRAFT_367040 [Ilyonectria robusta]KAH8664792.1 hypothetical protein BGZ61DRAFT_367040 [Ilyonectria robusta]